MCCHFGPEHVKKNAGTNKEKSNSSRTQSAVTRRIQETDEVIAMATPDHHLNNAKLAQLKPSLKEKLETLVGWMTKLLSRLKRQRT